jgi:hypothetical protein
MRQALDYRSQGGSGRNQASASLRQVLTPIRWSRVVYW